MVSSYSYREKERYRSNEKGRATESLVRVEEARANGKDLEKRLEKYLSIYVYQLWYYIFINEYLSLNLLVFVSCVESHSYLIKNFDERETGATFARTLRQDTHPFIYSLQTVLFYLTKRSEHFLTLSYCTLNKYNGCFFKFLPPVGHVNLIVNHLQFDSAVLL